MWPSPVTKICRRCLPDAARWPRRPRSLSRTSSSFEVTKAPDGWFVFISNSSGECTVVLLRFLCRILLPATHMAGRPHQANNEDTMLLPAYSHQPTHYTTNQTQNHATPRRKLHLTLPFHRLDRVGQGRQAVSVLPRWPSRCFNRYKQHCCPPVGGTSNDD